MVIFSTKFSKSIENLKEKKIDNTEKIHDNSDFVLNLRNVNTIITYVKNKKLIWRMQTNQTETQGKKKGLIPEAGLVWAPTEINESDIRAEQLKRVEEDRKPLGKNESREEKERRLREIEERGLTENEVGELPKRQLEKGIESRMLLALTRGLRAGPPRSKVVVEMVAQDMFLFWCFVSESPSRISEEQRQQRV